MGAVQKRPRGRPKGPTKLTEDTTRRYCEGLLLNLPRYLAAQYAGVSYATVTGWLARGEAGERPYDKFWAASRDAEARGAAQCMAVIAKAARDGEWKAAAWTLERRHGMTRNAPPGVVLHAHAVLDAPQAAPAEGDVIDAEELDGGADPETLTAARLRRLRVQLRQAERDGDHPAVAALMRQVILAEDRLVELRKRGAEAELDPLALDEERFIAELEGAARAMPEHHLRVLVDEYLRRHRMVLVATGGTATPLLGVADDE